MIKGKSFWSYGAGLLLLLTAACASVVGVLWWYYLAERKAVEGATLDQLTAIADAKAGLIANWRQERVGDARVWSASPNSRIAARVLAGAGSPQDQDELRGILRHLQQAFSYANAVLCDREGAVHLQLNSDFLDASRQRQWTEAALASGEVRISELVRDPASGRVFMAAVAPVDGAGALILYIDAAQFLYPFLRVWPTASATAESSIFLIEDNTTVYLSPLRYIPDAALRLRRPILPDNLKTIRELATGKPVTNLDRAALLRVPGGWYRIGPDYRGIASYTIIRLVPGSPWFLAAKIDSSEVFQPLARLSRELMGMLVLIALIYAGGIALLWRNHQFQIFSAQLESRNEIQALSERLVNSQEDERTRLARELHDHFGQELAVIGVGLSCLERFLPPADAAAQRQMEQTRERVVALAQSMRSLSHSLHPAVLEYSGLSTALAEYCEEFEAMTGLHICLEVEEPLPALPPAGSLALYRIVQEALQNVARHAGVKEARVELRRAGDGLRLRIADEGRGFDTGHHAGSFGLGLISMRERARQNGGTLELISKPGHGTALAVEIPVPAAVLVSKAARGA